VHTACLFGSLVLLIAAAKKENKPIKTGASNGHITNLKQYILETLDIYGKSVWANVINDLWLEIKTVPQ
jgi:hypothetical protein